MWCNVQETFVSLSFINTLEEMLDRCNDVAYKL